MTWNYRILKHTYVDDRAPTFALHEVYYDDDGKPDACTMEPLCGHWESVKELIKALGTMTRDARLAKADVPLFTSFNRQGGRNRAIKRRRTTKGKTK